MHLSFHLYLRIRLSVALFPSVTLLGLILENNNLFALAMAQHFCSNRRIGLQKECQSLPCHPLKRPHFVESDCGTFFICKLLNKEHVTFLNLVLFSACFNHSVHPKHLPTQSRRQKVAATKQTVACIYQTWAERPPKYCIIQVYLCQLLLFSLPHVPLPPRVLLWLFC